MLRPAVSHLVCLSLVLPLLTFACKSAPEAPHFNEAITASQADPELQALEAERARLVAERENVKTQYSKGSGAEQGNFNYTAYAAEVSETSKDEDIQKASEEVKKDASKGNHGSCHERLKKLLECLKSKKEKIEKKIEELDKKIEDCKAKKCKEKGNCQNPGQSNPPGKGGDVPTQTPPPGKGGDVPTQVPPSKGGQPEPGKTPPPSGGKTPTQNDKVPTQNGGKG